MTKNQNGQHIGRSRGGKARAERLTPEQRKAFAAEAAHIRWTGAQNLPKATHRGVLTIGNLTVPCAVLSDGRRVLSEHGITTALGSRSGASKRKKYATQKDGAPVPIFLAPQQLEPFITDEVRAALENPIRYRDGARVVDGFEAKWLPEFCDVWLRARAAGGLQEQQQERAQKAEILMRGLAHIGIVALVDEATGYQEERERDELHRLLAVYLTEERLRWAKRFPDEFYRQLYRLREWQWPNGGRRTPLVGKLTNKLVYEKLPPGVLDELQVRNPTLPGTGRRKWKHHQFLSEDLGQPDLRDHLMQLIAIMRVSKDWQSFEDNIDRAFPGAQGRLDLD